MAKWPYNTSTWAKLRRAKLMRDPLCYACDLRGRTEMAKAVDHIKAINKGGDPFPPLSGLMALCERCHNEKTNAVDMRKSSNGRRFKGFDVDGNPIDPNDDWHGSQGLSDGLSGHGGASNHEDESRAGPAAKTSVDLLENNSQKNWVF